MAKDTNGNGNGGKMAIRIISLVIAGFSLFAACSFAWGTMSNRITGVEVCQQKDTEARDKFEKRMGKRLDRMDEKLDALILHAEIRVPK